MSKLLTLFLSLSLVLLPTRRLAHSQQFTSSNFAKIKADIIRRDKSDVTLHLNNGSTLKGRITATAENMFTIREVRAKYPRHLNYSEVKKVSGRGLSRGAKFGILTSILTGTVLIGAILSLKKTDPMPGGVSH
jgi:hypothetical protein